MARRSPRKSRSKRRSPRKSGKRSKRRSPRKSGKKSKRRSPRKSRSKRRSPRKSSRRRRGRRSGKPLFRGEFKCNVKRSPTNDKKDLIKELRAYVNCVEKKTTINQDMSLSRLRGESVSDIKRHLKFYRDSY